MTLVIRPAAAEDADALIGQIDALNAHVGAASGRITPDILARDAFGRTRHLEFIVAERDGTIAGYAAWCDAYETEHARPGVYMIDLYVDPAHRRNGIARRLVAAVSAAARARGCGFVWWTAEPGNAEAAAFYGRLGSQSAPMIAHALYGEAFETLADEGQDSVQSPATK
ncbi:GNAT family N-acetyltransferase [Microbaculum marinum]|uniref:GNAT family N-acetyltransferase n=1 Tax=Microbaculum marinum TaxID=1764581 RepID=A0AAW9RDG0_9HYPH